MPYFAPDVTFAFREGDEMPEGGGCPIGGQFVYKTSKELFGGKRVVIFSLPGAFTPTCSSQQLPGYERLYDEFRAQGIDEIYCVSVNDAFLAISQCYESFEQVSDEEVVNLLQRAAVPAKRSPRSQARSAPRTTLQ